MGKAFGKPAIDYARKKALEIVTGEIDDTASFRNNYMERGNELEPLAIQLYEEEKFYAVDNGGFYEKGIYGDSPDGNIGSNGCLEVKCVIPNVHWERIEKGGIDGAYKWQVCGHLMVSGRDWCDFVSYCPEFAKGKQLYIHRVYRDEEMINKLKERLLEFEQLIKSKVEILQN